MSENPTINEDLLVRTYLPRDLVDVGRIFSSLGRESKFLSYAGSYVCCFMGLPVGIIVPRIAGRYLHIRELCTLKRFQRQGVATALIAFIEKRSIELSQVKSIVVKVPLDTSHSDAMAYFNKRYEFVQSVNDNLVFLDRLSKEKEVSTW